MTYATTLFLFLLASTSTLTVTQDLTAKEKSSLVIEEEGELSTHTQELFNEETFDEEVDEEEVARCEAFLSLDWKVEGVHRLPHSHATITLPEGYQLLIGEEAQKGHRLFPDDIENPNLEGTVYNEDFSEAINFEHAKAGYVSINDWNELDPKSLLESIIENTKEANKKRQSQKMEEVFVVGWLEKPVLDKETLTVYWAIEAYTETVKDLVNFVALKLGREGYERLVWATTKESYAVSGNHLETVLNSYTFDPGYRYSDYVHGDKLAALGIAGLVAATAGGKLIQAGGFFAFKKAIALIVAAIGGYLYKFKNFFKRKKTTET